MPFWKWVGNRWVRIRYNSNIQSGIVPSWSCAGSPHSIFISLLLLCLMSLCVCLCVCDNPSKKWVLFLGSHRTTFLSFFFVKAAHFISKPISKLWQTLDCFATHTKTHMQGGNTFSFVMSRGVGQHCCSNSLLLILWFQKSHVIAWSHRPSSEGIKLCNPTFSASSASQSFLIQYR